VHFIESSFDAKTLLLSRQKVHPIVKKKLSLAVPKILFWRRLGNVAHLQKVAGKTGWDDFPCPSDIRAMCLVFISQITTCASQTLGVHGRVSGVYRPWGTRWGVSDANHGVHGGVPVILAMGSTDTGRSTAGCQGSARASQKMEQYPL